MTAELDRTGPEQAPGTLRGRWGPLAVLLLGSTLTVMAGAVLSPVVAVMQGDLGISGTAAGLVLTAHGLTIAVVSPVVGWLIDRFGVRTLLAAGLVLYGLAGGLGLVLTSYPLLLASRLLFGVGAAVVFTGTTVALLAEFTGPDRDRVMGWRGTAMSLGGLAWPLLGGALGTLSWHGPFGIYLLGVPLGLAAWWTLSDRRTDDPTDDTAPATRPDAGEPGAGEQGAEEAGSMRTVLARRPVLLGYYLLLGAVTVLLYVLAVFLPLRLTEVGIADPLLIAVLGLGTTVAASVIGLGYGRLLRRLGYPTLLRAAFGLMVAGFAVLGVADAVPLIVLGPALFGLGIGVVMPALTVLIGTSAPDALRGRVIAWSGTATFVGQFLSPLLVGPLVEASTLTTGFLAAAGLAAVGLVGLFLLRIPTSVEAG